MAEVSLLIGERRHVVACRDGEEARLRQLGAMLNERWPVAMRAAGGHGSERAMLFTALMLADALDEAQSRPVAEPEGADVVDEAALDRLAGRLEAIAAALEEPASAS